MAWSSPHLPPLRMWTLLPIFYPILTSSRLTTGVFCTPRSLHRLHLTRTQTLCAEFACLKLHLFERLLTLQSKRNQHRGISDIPLMGAPQLDQILVTELPQTLRLPQARAHKNKPPIAVV